MKIANLGNEKEHVFQRLARWTFIETICISRFSIFNVFRENWLAILNVFQPQSEPF